MRSIVLILGMLACGGNAPQKHQVPGHFEKKGELLLTVNGHEVTANMVDASMRLTPASELERLKRSGGWVQRVEQIGMGELLYQDALKRGLHKDPDVQMAIKMATREVLAQENFAKQVTERMTEGTIKKYYDDHAVQYRRPQAHARHILVREEAVARDLLKDLQGGADFAELAAKHTLDAATKDKGGDLGWFNRNMLDPRIAKIAFEGPTKELQGPIETRFGFHLLEVLERRDMVPLEDVREEIEGKLRQETAETVLTQIKADMKTERHGEAKEIYAKTANWGMPDNPMGPTPPKAREGVDPTLPGVRQLKGGSSPGPGGGAKGPHGPGGGGAAGPHGGGH